MQQISLDKTTVPKRKITASRAMILRKKLRKPSGIYSAIQIQAAGFENIDTDHTFQCLSCGLQVSEWPSDIEPFALHAQLTPACSFVLSLRPVSINTPPTTATTDDDQSRRLTKCDPLLEVRTLKMARERTFSHWSHRRQHSAGSMIEAGFFNCNVGDRVICLYCNMTCQGWRDCNDDASAVHKALSPVCRYVTSMLMGAALSSSSSSSIFIVNERTATSDALTSINSDAVRCNSIVTTNACHPRQAEITRRHASFASWASENVPSVDDLVRSGFFYTGSQTIVTCFFCNGSLQNWGPKDNPMVEHARWFPHCAYIKQLCGSQLYQQIRDAQQNQREKSQADINEDHVPLNGNRLTITDERTLSRLVAARLDLPVSQRLLNQDFKVSVIKRCWEDQLRLKGDDFVCDTDLWTACTILQKQIDHINGNKENIILPGAAMKEIREKQHAETSIAGTKESSSNTNSSSDSTESNMTESGSLSNEVKIKQTQVKNKDTDTVANPCALCLSEEKNLACLPCGHLATCVPCGHSLRSCPICRQAIQGFVRVYL